MIAHTRQVVRITLYVATLWLFATPAIACSVAMSTKAGPFNITRVGDGVIDTVAYGDPTDIYGHAIMGNLPEAQTLSIEFGGFDALRCEPLPGKNTSLHVGAGHVFEDIAPRVIDLDGDGLSEIITVRSSLTKGAQIAIYGPDMDRPLGPPDAFEYHLIATTPYIGRSNRWLAPAAWGDLDGDSKIEIAYVDRPHLAKILRVWRYVDGALREVATLDGVTNHRIGEEFISGGQRDCGTGPEIVLAKADWSGLVAVRFDGRNLSSDDLGPGLDFAAALACR